MEPVEPVQKNIYQSNTYRKDLSWLHFDDEPRVQEMQQVKGSTYPFLELIQEFQVAIRSTSPDMTAVFRTWSYGRFIEIQSKLRETNFIERIKAPIFLEAVLAIETM